MFYLNYWAPVVRIYVCLSFSLFLKNEIVFKKSLRDFCDGPVVKTALPRRGIWVQFLVGELGSHMLHHVTKNKQITF